MQSEANTGSAILQGSDPFGMTVQALGCSPASHGKHFRGRYPSANLHHNGTWYAGTYALNDGNRVLGPFVGFRTSRTRGESWVQEPALTPTSSIFEEEKFGGGVIRIGAPHFVDFGRDMEHSPDGRAYMVSHGGVLSCPHCPAGWIVGSAVYLMRTRNAPSAETINDPESWEFFSGNTTAGETTWSPSVNGSKPLFEWPNHTGVTTITYSPKLKRYLMCVSSSLGFVQEHLFDSYVLESAALTGPWHLIDYMKVRLLRSGVWSANASVI